MTKPTAFSVDTLAIPQDIRVGEGWTSQMREMADHIGAYATLMVCEHFGGQDVYIAADPDRNVLRDVIGPEKARIMSQVYRRETIAVPMARLALARARRGAVIALARRGEITIRAAAQVLKTTRSYMSHLVNHGDEGDDAPAASVAEVRRTMAPIFKKDPRQIDMFDPASHHDM